MIQEKYGHYRLSSYGPVRLTLPDLVVSDEEVSAEMERIAARHATNVTVEPHAVRADDLLLINIVTKEGQRIFPGLTHEGVDVQLGVGTLPEALEVALLGHAVGDTVEASFDYEDYSQVASEREAPADGGCGVGDTGEPELVSLTAQVTVLAQRKFVVPPITDEWVQKNIALSNSVEEFRCNTRKKLAANKRREYANSVEYDVAAEMGKRLIDEVPEQPVESMVKQLYREFDRFLEEYEMDRATYLATQGLDDAAFAEQVVADARDRIAQDIALAAWATHEGVTLDDEDIDFMFGEPTPERTYEARVEAEQSGQIDTFRDLALRAKAASLLTQQALFFDAEGKESKRFEEEIAAKYRKLSMVRKHATSKPMTQPPMMPVSN